MSMSRVVQRMLAERLQAKACLPTEDLVGNHQLKVSKASGTVNPAGYFLPIALKVRIDRHGVLPVWIPDGTTGKTQGPIISAAPALNPAFSRVYDRSVGRTCGTSGICRDSS